MSDASDKRAGSRQPVLKTAKLHVGSGVVDCLVLDTSPTGVRVSTEGLVKLPAEVVVELRSGGMFKAICRWQRGIESGLEFSGFAGLNEAAGRMALHAYQDLGTSGLRDVVTRLEGERFFEYPELKAATEKLGQAYSELFALLQTITRQRKI